jgi:hypothetical protein
MNISGQPIELIKDVVGIVNKAHKAFDNVEE